MTHLLLHRILRQAFCALALLTLAVPLLAQNTNNAAILSNFGRGDGESRTVFALGARAYYGVGNRIAISDFSNPLTPVTLGSASLPDRVEDVVPVGNRLYVASGDGMHIFNVQNPTQVQKMGSVPALSYGEGLAVNPPYVLFGDGSAGLRILDATNAANITQVAQLDTLGYVEGVSYSGDIAYVAAGSRVHMINYSNPAAPTYVGRVGSPLDYYQSTTVRGSFLFIADFFGGFRVFDISNPASPADVGFFDPADRTARISLDGDFAYLANGDKGVTILNIADPTKPAQVAVIDTPRRALQASVSGTLVYIADTDGIRVYNIANPAAPVFQSSIDVQARAPGKAFGVNVEGNYAYVAYGDAGLRILDITTPTGSMPQVGQIGVKNASDEGQARQVVVSGSYAYVASRAAGVKVFNVSNPAAPTLVTTLDVSDAGDVALDGTTLAVAGGSGITVFSLADPANPTQLFASEGLGYADRVGVSGGYAYAITTGSNVRIFDLSNPASIALVGTVATGGDYSEGRLSVQGDYLYTTNGDLLIVDVSNKTAPQVAGTYDAPSYAYSANVKGNYAYVATERDGVRIIDVSDPAAPVEAGFAAPGGEIRDIAFKGSLLIAANGEAGVTAIQNTLVTAITRGPAVSAALVLYPVQPNPFTTGTTIQFVLAQPGAVQVDVYNAVGQHVATVARGAMPAGLNTIPFDARGLAGGTYLLQVRTEGQQVSRQMVIVK